MVITKERKTLDYYFGLVYPVTLEAAPEGGYVAEIEDLPGCYSQGETAEEAMEMIEEARRLWLEVAYEEGVDIAEPRSAEGYSGHFYVRMPRTIHKKLSEMADKEGVSLNQFLVSTLSRVVGIEEGEKKARRKNTPKKSA